MGDTYSPGKFLTARCAVVGCHHGSRPDFPVCRNHAISIYLTVKDEIEASQELLAATRNLDKRKRPGMPKPPPVVYYLRVGPETVKIGTTIRLATRIQQLRSQPDYVMAVELGGYEVEHQRHKEFATERHGRREDFRLTARLLAHIDDIAASSDSRRLVAEMWDRFKRPNPSP